MQNKILIAFLVGTIIVIGVYTHAHGYLTLESLKHYQTHLNEAVEQRPVTSGLTYLVVYVTVTALSIPGAVILTLAGGALFGLLWGSILVSLASTLGATLAFLIARSICRAMVAKQFGDRLQRVRDGFEADGAFYLFSLRLVPIIPFFVINILMALTSIRVSMFFTVSLLGMLPATLVYVNAGTELARIHAVEDIVSFRLLLSFAILAAFPWLARVALRLVRKS